MLILGFIAAFVVGVCFGILIIGLMAANDELERKGRHDE